MTKSLHSCLPLAVLDKWHKWQLLKKNTNTNVHDCTLTKLKVNANFVSLQKSVPMLFLFYFLFFLIIICYVIYNKNYIKFLHVYVCVLNQFDFCFTKKNNNLTG